MSDISPVFFEPPLANLAVVRAFDFFDALDIHTIKHFDHILVSRNGMCECWRNSKEEDSYKNTLDLLRSTFPQHKYSWSFKDDNYFYLSVE